MQIICTLLPTGNDASKVFWIDVDTFVYYYYYCYYFWFLFYGFSFLKLG